MGYTRDTIKGLTWTAALRGAMRGMTLVRYAILWRFLVPSEFGLYSITSIVLALIEILTETGVNIYLVQIKQDIAAYINTAWIVSIIRGFLITTAILITAPFVARFFNTPNVLSLLLLVAFVPLIRGFINPAEIVFQKELAFHKEFWFRGFLFFLESCVAIWLALATRSASSLVWALIVSAAAEVFLSFLVIKPRPAFSFQVSQMRDMFRQGKWITAAGIFNYLYHNADNIIVGKLLGTTSLGYYDAAYKIAMLPITEIGDIVTKVTLPVYAKIVGDNPRLLRALKRTVISVSLITIPLGVILFFFPETVVQLALGAKALPAVPVLRILAVFGVVRAISTTPTAIFYATGKQSFVTVITLVSFMVLAGSIVPLVQQFGLVGAAYSALIATFAAVPIVVYYIWKL
jgi:O-antigen/teichoic acid export membrane protein